MNVTRCGISVAAALALLSVSSSASAEDAPEEAELAAAPAETTPAPMEAPLPPLDVGAVVAPDPTRLGWPSSPTPPGPSVRPRSAHREDMGRIVFGTVLFGVGYVGALAWGIHVLANIPLGNLSCNDLYGGLTLIPLVGPVSAAGAASGCVSLRFEEVLLPVLTTIAQLAGGISFLLGLAGNTSTEYETLSVNVIADPSGGGRVVFGGRL